MSTGEQVVPSAAKTIATLILAVIAFGLACWCIASADRSSTDRGIVSTMAIAGLSPHQALLGDVTIAGFSPESLSAGRVTVWTAMGTTALTADGAPPGAPAESLTSREGTGDGSPTADDRRGVTFVIGGSAARAFEACDPDVDATVWAGVTYDELSSVERTAIVESVALQLRDRRAQYGSPTSTGSTEAIDIASAMTFTVIEPGTLDPRTWTMDGRAPGPTTTPTDSYTEISDQNTSDGAGWGTMFHCDVSLESMWSRQSWGERFEIPALGVAATPIVSQTQHTTAYLGIVRPRELSRFSFSETQGFEVRKLEESWAGLSSERSAVWSFSDTRPAVAMPDATVRFASMDASSSRDIALFLAGVTLSLFASLVVAAVVQILARREHAKSR